MKIYFKTGSYIDIPKKGLNKIKIEENKVDIEYEDGTDLSVNFSNSIEEPLNWRLPTTEELNLMYENLHLKGIGRFVSEDYWSSSEDSSNSAWYQYFGFGCSQGNYSKLNSIRARAVRSFKSQEDFEIGQETETGYVFDIQRDVIFECKKEDEPELMNWYEAMEEFDNQGENK